MTTKATMLSHSILATMSAMLMAGCLPTMTVPDFVNNRLFRDPAMKALVIGADKAQAAYNLVATTHMEDLDEGSEQSKEIAKLVDAAHDAYRDFAHYGDGAPGHLQSSTLTPRCRHPRPAKCSDVKLIGLDDPNVNTVPIMGTSTLLRVNSTPERVVILGIDSNLGKPIVTFNAFMTPTVTPDFRSYLIGDVVDVAGVAKRRIRRGDGDATKAVQPPPPVMPSEYAAPPTTPAAPSGCSKDTDCKGDRICIAGQCQDPR